MTRSKHDHEFSDAQFMSAHEKKNVLNAWIGFVRNGFEFRHFTRRLYSHLIQHCSFIAHYDRGGFWGTYFRDPDDTQRFLDQFDRSKGCVSVEYRMAYWIQGGNDVCADYYDLNNAMVDAIADILPELREWLRICEIQNAEIALQAAQDRVTKLTSEPAAAPAAG